MDGDGKRSFPRAHEVPGDVHRGQWTRYFWLRSPKLHMVLRRTRVDGLVIDPIRRGSSWINASDMAGLGARGEFAVKRNPNDIRYNMKIFQRFGPRNPQILIWFGYLTHKDRYPLILWLIEKYDIWKVDSLFDGNPWTLHLQTILVPGLYFETKLQLLFRFLKFQINTDRDFC